MAWVAAATTAATIGTSLYTANKASKAAKNAAKTQVDSADRAIQSQEDALRQTRQDLAPYRDAGEAQLDPLGNLVDYQQNLATDPNAQRSYVQENPFFKMLADDAQKRIFNNQAARGKVGSGETAQALQNSIMLLGNDLVNNNLNQTNSVFSNRLNIASMGGNAAARTGNATLGTANNISNLQTDKGNVNAAGIIGVNNARTDGINNLIDTGLGAYQMYQNSQDTTSPGGTNLEFIDKSLIRARR
tara:strand:+ start:437 stop:1171 length:735 start_codon:yes stop_codon:yes gene_type:complete